MLIEIINGADGYPARPKFITGKQSMTGPKPVANMVLRAFENDITLF